MEKLKYEFGIYEQIGLHVGKRKWTIFQQVQAYMKNFRTLNYPVILAAKCLRINHEKGCKCNAYIKMAQIKYNKVLCVFRVQGHSIWLPCSITESLILWEEWIYLCYNQWLIWACGCHIKIHGGQCDPDCRLSSVQRWVQHSLLNNSGN